MERDRPESESAFRVASGDILSSETEFAKVCGSKILGDWPANEVIDTQFGNHAASGADLSMFDDAAEVAALVADEEFGELNLLELEEDEKKLDGIPCLEITGVDSPPNADMSELCSVDEITIR